MDLHTNGWGYERQPKADEAKAAPVVEAAPAVAPVVPAVTPDIDKASLANLLAQLKSGEATITAEIEEGLKKLGVKA